MFDRCPHCVFLYIYGIFNIISRANHEFFYLLFTLYNPDWERKTWLKKTNLKI